MFQATRLRLALWYALVTGVLLLLFAGGFYAYVRLTLIDRIDDTIAHVAEVVERSLARTAATNLEGIFGANAADLEPDRIDIEWFDLNGQLLWTTMPRVPAPPLALEGLLLRSPIYRTVRLSDGDALRQFTELVAIDNHPLGILRVSHPWFEVTKPIQQLFLDLAVGTVATIAIVGVCGWWLSGLAMQPVRESYQRLKQFTADASHELRNPVAVIQTNVQVALADDRPDGTVLRQQLEVIERLTRRLSRLLDDLLFLARQDSDRAPALREPCDVVAVLRDVCEEQQTVATAKGIALTLLVPEGAVTVLGDRDLLARLFTNLTSNAITYTPSGGQVTVELQVSPAIPTLTVRVCDTGVGIPADILPRIFDRFYRHQPRSREGAGLGLAIAQSIVESHHGTIEVTSTLDEGTTFTVSLPLAKGKA